MLALRSWTRSLSCERWGLRRDEHCRNTNKKWCFLFITKEHWTCLVAAISHQTYVDGMQIWNLKNLFDFEIIRTLRGITKQSHVRLTNICWTTTKKLIRMHKLSFCNMFFLSFISSNKRLSKTQKKNNNDKQQIDMVKSKSGRASERGRERNNEKKKQMCMQ